MTLSVATRDAVTRRAPDRLLRQAARCKIEFPFDAVHVDFMLKAA